MGMNDRMFWGDNPGRDEPTGAVHYWAQCSMVKTSSTMPLRTPYIFWWRCTVPS